MDASRVLVVGLGSNFATKQLLTNFNLHEYHTIIWSLASLERELPRINAQHYTSGAAADAASQRLKELADWVSEGHNLIIVLEVFSDVKVHRQNITTPFNLQDCEILAPIQFQQVAGERVQYIGSQNAELEKLSKHLRYVFVLTAGNASPLFRVARSAGGPDQVVGLTLQHGSGRLFFIPPASTLTPGAYTEVLAHIPDELAPRPAELPEWTTEYESASEVKASATISERLREIRGLQVEVDAGRQMLVESAWMKQLFAGSGADFANAVSRALKDMDLDVEPGPHPRADLLVRNGDSIGAAEVKGLDGSARENNLRQTERWVAEVNSALSSSPQEREADPDLVRYGQLLAALKIPLEGKHQASCKGIIIIGTFRKVPLDSRTENDFPEAVLRIAEREEICALTGLDLLLWLLVAQNDAAQKQVFRRQLFSTSGRLKAPAEWKSLIFKKEIAV